MHSDSTSIWGSQPEVPAPEAAPLQRDERVEVAVVGGGITGLTTAVRLARSGRRVALLEARELGSGTTGHTTGHLSTLPDGSYRTLADTFGSDGARAVHASMAAAVDEVEGWARRLAADHGVDCGFRRLPGWLYQDGVGEEAGDASQLEAELDAARAAGATASWADGAPLPFPVGAALRFEAQAQLQPLAYLRGLALDLVRAGGLLYPRTPVLEVHDARDDTPCRLRTAGGELRAEAVVLATHTPIGVNPLHTEVAPYRSYALALRVDGPPPDALLWDTAEPYRYTRSYRPADGPDLLVIGGADHKTGSVDDTGERFAALERYARERWSVREVVRRWSSQYYPADDRLPFIGRSPLSEKLFLGTGYGGDGLVFGTLAGMMLSDALLGRSNPWAELYAPARLKPGAKARRWLRENLDVARRLGERLQRHPEVPAGVAPGEGRVIDHEGRKLAVYRDPQGVAHVRSAVCTHLGCVVHWNAAERSWDCPCHGARYGVDGEVLVGPATKALQRPE